MNNRPKTFTDEELNSIHLDADTCTWSEYNHSLSIVAQKPFFVIKFHTFSDSYAMTYKSPDDYFCENKNTGETVELDKHEIANIENRLTNKYSSNASLDNCLSIAKARFNLEQSLNNEQFSYSESRPVTAEKAKIVMDKFDSLATSFLFYSDHYLPICLIEGIRLNSENYIKLVIGRADDDSTENAEDTDDTLYANFDKGERIPFVEGMPILVNPISIEVATISSDPSSEYSVVASKKDYTVQTYDTEKSHKISRGDMAIVNISNIMSEEMYTTKALYSPDSKSKIKFNLHTEKNKQSGNDGKKTTIHLNINIQDNNQTT